MKPLTTIIFLFVLGNSYAQFIDITNEQYTISLNNTNAKIIADGTPYINETYLPVKIDTFKEVTFTGRFNAYNGQMEIIPSTGKSPIALNINTGSYVVLFIESNKEYQTYKFEDNSGVSGINFFVNVHKNKISLLKKEIIKFFDKVPAASSYQQEKPAKFVKQDDIFFYKLNGDDIIAKELPTKDKDIANIFPEHSKTILAYIKTEKLKTKKEEDLIKLFEYINTL